MRGWEILLINIKLTLVGPVFLIVLNHDLFLPLNHGGRNRDISTSMIKLTSIQRLYLPPILDPS